MAKNQTSLQSTVETMYRFTADDYTREEIRAREEELRVQRTIESIHKRELKERDDKIAEQQKQLSDKDMENISNKLNVVAEAYPNLKSNTNYKELMNELSVTENLIAQHRITYNKAIKSYKRYCRKFPTNTFLSITNYEIVNFDYLSYDVSEDAPTNLFED